MAEIFRRRELADQMAQQLLRPGPLDEGLRSGLFLSGIRRTGKTTFLLNDLIPALEAAGALVIYVDLWSDPQASPADLVQAAVAQKLHEIQTPDSQLLQRLKRLRAAEFDAFGIKFGFQVDSVGKEGGPTLAQALAEVVDQARTDVVLIVDEVQHAIASDEGERLLLSLKAARDAINPRPNTQGHFIFVGTGSHRAHVNEMTTRRNQAFTGATSLPYPVLGSDYITYLLQRIGPLMKMRCPSVATTLQAFQTLGCRPEELLKALRLLGQTTGSDGDPDTVLRLIAKSLRSAAAEIEIEKLRRMGSLAEAIFERISKSGNGTTGLFSADAASAYSAAIGREVRVEEVQPVMNALLNENIVMRLGQGRYCVSDPFVQEIWNELQVLTRLPD